MSRTAKDWQKAKQQAQHIRDTLHKLKKTLHRKATPLANQIIGHGAYSWDGCATCYQTELIKQLIEGHHKTRRADQTNILSQ